MKCALIVFGHMRTYERCFPSLKQNLIDIYNPDVFIHTWDEKEAGTVSWHTRHMKKRGFRDGELADICRLYGAKKMDVGHQERPEEDKTTPGNGISVVGQRYMVDSMKYACDLKSEYEKENNIKYDVVIKIRPDVKLINKLKFKAPDNRTVLIAGNRSVPEMTQDPSKYRACDILNISNSENMDKVCQISNSFDEFFLKRAREGTVKHTGFVDQIWDQGLNVVFMDYRYNRDWTIIREQSK